MTATASDKRDPAAVTLGRRGGLARAARMTPQQRSEAGRYAATARWMKKATKTDVPGMPPLTGNDRRRK